MTRRSVDAEGGVALPGVGRRADAFTRSPRREAFLDRGTTINRVVLVKVGHLLL